MSAIAGAIERKARELGVWRDAGQGLNDGVTLCPDGSGGYCIFLNGAEGPGGSYGLEASPLTAALWLLVMEAGHTIDRGECTACAERGGGWEWSARSKYRTAEVYMGAAHKDMARMDLSWILRDVIRWGAMWQVVAARPCPTCAVDGEPTGRVHTPAHEVMLGALPSFDVAEHTMAALFDIEQKQPLREDIEVLATKLELQGDPLGVLLALWLAGKLEQRHVLGAEELEVPPGDISYDPEGWTCTGGTFFTDEGEKGSVIWRRPILEANP